MSILNLLTEVRNDINSTQKKLENMFIKHMKSTSFKIWNNEVDDMTIYTRDSDKYARSILDADPTSSGKYVDWILKNYFKKIIERVFTVEFVKVGLIRYDGKDFSTDYHPVGRRFYEDLPKVEEYLKLFHDNKDKIKDKEINNYSFDQLESVVRRFRVSEDGQRSLDDLKALVEEFKDYEIIENNSNEWEIIKLLSEKGACVFGVGSEWCTSWGKHSLNTKNKGRTNQFEHYKDGSVYVIISKLNPSHKYQYAPNSGQFMDLNDWEIKIDNLKDFDETTLYKLISLSNVSDYIEISRETDKQLLKLKMKGVPSHYFNRIVSEGGNKIYGFFRGFKYNKDLLNSDKTFKESGKRLLQIIHIPILYNIKEKKKLGNISVSRKDEIIFTNIEDLDDAFLSMKGLKSNIKNLVKFVEDDSGLTSEIEKIDETSLTISKLVSQTIELIVGNFIILYVLNFTVEFNSSQDDFYVKIWNILMAKEINEILFTSLTSPYNKTENLFNNPDWVNEKNESFSTVLLEIIKAEKDVLDGLFEFNI